MPIIYAFVFEGICVYKTSQKLIYKLVDTINVSTIVYINYIKIFFVVLLTGVPDPQRRVYMARLGKQISSPPSTPIARRLHAMASRKESSYTTAKWQRTE